MHALRDRLEERLRDEITAIESEAPQPSDRVRRYAIVVALSALGEGNGSDS